jgi:copper chaperone NosL
MKAAPLLAVALLVSACASVSPIPIRAGDVCFHCRRTIVDPSLAAEVISDQGHAFKFSSVTCLTEYLREHPEEGVRATFVTDHARGRLFAAGDAYYVRFVSDPTIGQVDFAAYRDKAAASAFAAKNKTTPIDWAGVQAAGIEHGAH